jgi:hypothetical protein
VNKDNQMFGPASALTYRLACHCGRGHDSESWEEASLVSVTMKENCLRDPPDPRADAILVIPFPATMSNQ